MKQANCSPWWANWIKVFCSFKYLFVLISWSKRMNTIKTNMYNSSVTIYKIEDALSFVSNVSLYVSLYCVFAKNNPSWFWSMHVLYNLSLYSVSFKNIRIIYYWDLLMLIDSAGLNLLGIHCLHNVLCLFLFETNSKNKQVPKYSHTSRWKRA